MNRGVIFAAALAAVAAAHPAQAAVCPFGLFGVAAQIVRIEPVNAKLKKKRTDGSMSTVDVDDVICLGESLPLPLDGPVSRVELLVSGRKEVRVPPASFESRQGPREVMSQALASMSDFVRDTDKIKSAPDIPQPTASRGVAGASTPSPVVQITAMRLLQDLPRQRIAEGVRPVISWRDGAGPYVCQAISEDGRAVWASDKHVDSWCEITPNLSQATQLVVEDANGQLKSWNIKTVAWADVPKPEWLRNAASPSSADRTAWALWLWREPDKVWRLQALGMLDELAAQEWAAGYLRNHLLSGLEREAP